MVTFGLQCQMLFFFPSPFQLFVNMKHAIVLQREAAVMSLEKKNVGVSWQTHKQKLRFT